MNLVEGVPGDLPVMFLVEIAKRDGIGENLIQVFSALRASGFVESDRQLGDFSVGLNFARMLVKNRAGTVRSGVMIGL
jgi:hypothetical protein